MELTNKQRKYLGLELIDPSWDRVEIPNNCVKPELSTGKDILFFDGDILRKVIWMRDTGDFLENSYFLRTQNGRSEIAPITAKGKPKRLNGVNIQRCTPRGMYLSFYGGYEKRGGVLIANYDTQRTYFSSSFAGQKPMDVSEFQQFLDTWIAETGEEDMAELEAFVNAKRRHCKYREGDFFRFKFDRRHYGYGRILMDVRKWIKDGGKFWDILMGKALCVSIYHIVTEDPNVSIADLQQLKSCPSGYIMDNLLYYGEFEIIGNVPFGEGEDMDYPIMYGRSISAIDRDKVCYCEGKEYREIPLAGAVLPQKDFKNNGIGFRPHIDKAVIEECIRAGSNEPFWARMPETSYTYDLRHPAYKKELEQARARMEG